MGDTELDFGGQYFTPPKLNNFEYKNKVYELVHYATMQVGQTWLPCIVYKNETGRVFVRERKDFEEKFKRHIK